MKNEIEKLIKKQSTTMSKYQIDNFVINDKMTSYKILKQILLELGTRYSGLEDLELDIESADLELELLESELTDITKDSIEYKLKKIEIKKQLKAIKTLSKTLSNYMYEIKILEDNFAKIKEIGDPETILNDEKGEEIYWVNKFVKEAQIDIMTSGRIGKGILDAILMLDEKLQKTIIDNAISQATLSNLYLSSVENEVISNIKEINKPSLMLNQLVEETKV